MADKQGRIIRMVLDHLVKVATDRLIDNLRGRRAAEITVR